MKSLFTVWSDYYGIQNMVKQNDTWIVLETPTNTIHYSSYLIHDNRSS